ncbi:MAG: HNH endonuclease family protein [Oculatellaceae cyanobacterium Prado106]|nr:HNH endonuclease family protein [Oculatellaceae cyanobacterium Prado106]
MDELENYSSLFIALGNSNDDFWRDHPDNRSYIRELELFRVKQAYPALFAAYRNFSSDHFTRLLKLVCVLSFRYTVVSSLNPNELETLYNKVAISIMGGEITHPRQAFDALRSIYVSDEKFSQDFSLLSISTKGQKKLVRYILWKLEIDASERQDISEDGFSIEHILPESPTDDWRENFSEAQIEEMTYRLGNLTPLEPNLNRQVGNESYSVKQEVYRQSVYRLTQNILAEEWVVYALAARQRLGNSIDFTAQVRFHQFVVKRNPSRL